MIDDELLQELLVRATGLYNNGDYRGAIAAWREALEVDPASQKAREGIQMATLLLADWDPAAPAAPSPEPAPAADGAVVRPSRPEADARRIDDGVKRVRALLLERKYSEAIEGARGLVPIDPDSEEVQRLVDEAQQAFESAPFIDEHLTLARELLEQGRRPEAEAECRKVFTLDPANPDAHALLAEIQSQATAAPAEPEPPTGDLGGRTMRIDRSQLQAFQISKDSPRGQAAAPPAEPAADATTEEAAADAAGFDFGELPELPADGAEAGAPVAEGGPEPELDFSADEALDLDAGAETPEAETPLPALAVEEAAEPLVETAAADPVPDVEGIPEGGSAVPTEEIEAPIELESLDLGAEPPAAEAPAEPEVIEATTVVPPSVRLVERSPEGQAAIDRLMEQLDEDTGAIESIPLAIPAPAAAAAAAPSPPPVPAPPARAAAPPPVPAKPGAAQGGWEQELESLNQKSGQHEIVGRSAARAASVPAAPDEDVDLTALMGDEIGSLQAPPAVPPADAPEPEADLSPPPAPPVEADAEPAARAAAARNRAQERAARIAMAAQAAERPGRSMNSLFALLGVVILAAAAVVWWFFFQPRTALGRSQPPAAAAPPSASSGRAPSEGPIPTPIGSTSRQPDPGPPSTAHPPAEAPAPAGGPSPSGATAPAPASAQDGANPATQTNSAPAPAAARPRSAEELRAETAQHLSAGKTFMEQERWQDARRELAAALALDPVNFECKELLQKAQAKVEQETKVRGEYDEARQLFQDKDYQGALWKLYRLPKDPRYGNLDVPIANSWYNWAVVALKGGDATTATQKLNEVLQVNADDADAEKMMRVAAQYSSRAKDKGFYSFVDTLRFRSFDGK